MEIIIFVHSHTGNTLSVAQRLKERLIKEGHSVQLEKLEALNEKSLDKEPVYLKKIPNISNYDVLIFGGPVQGFSSSEIMKVCMLQMPLIREKIVGCFVTQYFPYPWMGGNRAIKQMKQRVDEKAGVVWATGIVNWSHRKREQRIDEVVEKLSKFY